LESKFDEKYSYLHAHDFACGALSSCIALSYNLDSQDVIPSMGWNLLPALGSSKQQAAGAVSWK
jgi:hypothetical protein